MTKGYLGRNGGDILLDTGLLGRFFFQKRLNMLFNQKLLFTFKTEIVFNLQLGICYGINLLLRSEHMLQVLFNLASAHCTILNCLCYVQYFVRPYLLITRLYCFNDEQSHKAFVD